MNNQGKLVVAFAIFAVLAAVFVTIGQTIQTLPLENVPSWALPIVTIIANFFTYAPVAFGLAWLRNLSGFFSNWIQLHKTQEVDYELQRYYKTIAYYLGPFTVALAAIPPPYNAVGAALVFVIDVFTAEWKKIQPPPPS